MVSLNQYVSEYIATGFSLVPIPAGSKAPNNPGWNEQKKCVNDILNIHKITHNVGLAHCYSTPITCTIDIDDMNLADAWMRQRGVDLKSLLNAPDSVQICSGKPNRGKLLYRLPDYLGVLSTIQIRDGQTMVLEFRCVNCV